MEALFERCVGTRNPSMQKMFLGPWERIEKSKKLCYSSPRDPTALSYSQDQPKAFGDTHQAWGFYSAELCFKFVTSFGVRTYVHTITAIGNHRR